MSEITPQQMRELANLDALDYRFRMNDVRAALRAAADQLEAVRSPCRIEELHARWHSCDGNLFGRDECGWERCDFYDAADFILTADTTPRA